MIECQNCNTENKDDASTCKICSFPIQGTEQERSSFIAKQLIQKRDVEESFERLNKSRIILFMVAAFYLVVPFTPLMNFNSILATTFSILLGLFFIGFAFLTYKKPMVAIGIPLGLTILYYLLLLIIDPILLFTGILWKLIIVVGLGFGFYSANKSRRIFQKNPYLASKFRKGGFK